jgi:tungstate transport system substrate-binding protein
MMRRRLLLSLAAASSLAVPFTTRAAQRKSLADPLLMGVEQALLDSGLGQAFQKGFGRDTGVAVQVSGGQSAALIQALERGEIDMAMTNTPELEMALEKQGLAHDRHRVALGDYVLIGPVEGKGKKAKDPAGVLGGKDIGAALMGIANAQARFLGNNNGSGAALAELPLWRASKVAPAAPWYVAADPKSSIIAQAAAQNAYAVVERGVWLSRPAKPLAIVVEGDPLLVTEVHVMRAFRVNHPAAKLFTTWITGPQGRRVAAGVRGWRSATD